MSENSKISPQSIDTTTNPTSDTVTTTTSGPFTIKRWNLVGRIFVLKIISTTKTNRIMF